jgi:hypothetical protein
MTWFSLHRENYAHTGAFIGCIRLTETEVEHDDTEPTRQIGRRPRPRVAGETRSEAYTEGEIETAAARTLADTQAKAATGTARAREAAIERRGITDETGRRPGYDRMRSSRS